MSEEGCRNAFETKLVEAVKAVPLKPGFFFKDEELFAREFCADKTINEDEIM